jgi:adenylyltransferase/sulfurtransferase
VDLPVEELRRYSRHLALPEVGLEGQLRLRRSRVLVVGAGGLGSPVALYLAAAGVGTIGLVDDDRVDLTNLQRQVLYGTSDLDRPKTERARRRLSDLNPHVQVVPHELRLVAANALDVLRAYDVIVDGSDNFPTRYLVSDACALLGKPHVYGSIYRFEGQVSLFWAGRGPCYRCLFPEPPEPGSVPSCAEGGVLGILPGVIGALQATEAIKLVLERGTTLLGRLLLFDALELRFRELALARDPDCPACGERRSIRELVDVEARCAVDAGDAAPEIDAAELKRRVDASTAPLLLDVRTDGEFAIARIEGATLIPLDRLAERLGELDRARETVVYCHHGSRSASAVSLLRANGFDRVSSLAGGIDAWSTEVDPTVPRY